MYFLQLFCQAAVKVQMNFVVLRFLIKVALAAAVLECDYDVLEA
jgi:hypothetical protein